MAIQLPEELQYLLVVVVGERWPEADEDKLREMAQVWYRLADRFEDALRAGDSPAQAILAENFGESITAFGKCWERFSVGGEGGSQGYLRDAAEMCRNFGEALEQFAGDVEATKDYILIQLGILAAEVALGVAGSVFTFGVSGAAAAAATAATRVVIQQALKQLLRQALKHAVKMAVRGAIEGVLDNALLQGLKQIHGGSPVNVQELLLSGAQGAAGGALGAGFGAGANRFGRHLPGGDGFVKEAAQEFAAEVATNAAVSYGTAALTGQDVGISDILGGAGHGMATSGAHHLGDKRGGGDKLAGMSLPGGGSGSPTGLLDGLTETTGSGGGGTGISAALTTQTTSGPASGGVLDLDGGSRPAGAGAGGPATLDGSPPTRAGDGASVLADGGSGGAATPPRDGSGPAFSDSGPTHGVAGDAPVRAETATSPADAAGGRTETATADGGGSPVDSARDAGRAEPTGRAEAPRTDAPGNPTDSGTPTAGGRTDHGAAPGRPDAPITAHTAAVESPPREAGLGAPAQGAPSSHDGPARPAVDTGAPHAPVGDTRGDGPAERAPAGDGRAAAADGPRADSDAQHGATGPAQPRGADTAPGPAPSHGGHISGPTPSHGGPTTRGATPAASASRTGDRPEQAELAFNPGTSPDRGSPPRADAAPDGTGPRADALLAGGVPRGVDAPDGTPRTRPAPSGDIPGQRRPADGGPAPRPEAGSRPQAARPDSAAHTLAGRPDGDAGPQTVRPDQDQHALGGQIPRHGAGVPGPQARPHSPDQGRWPGEPASPYGQEGPRRFRDRLWDRIKRILFGPDLPLLSDAISRNPEAFEAEAERREAARQEQNQEQRQDRPRLEWRNYAPPPLQHRASAAERAREAQAYAEHMRAVREYAHQYLQPHQQGDVYAHAPVLWDIANGDVGRLMKDEDPRAQVSALTGSDVPPPADTTRPYDQPGGLRRPLLQHQEDLELLLPRNLDGSFQRMPDLLLPSGEVAPWVRAINDGGPQADPTRGQNCVDCTLSFRETWGHARARVAAPRTFDGYANGDVNQVLFGELDGTGRTEDVTGGRYQGLTGDLRNVPPDQARQAVQDAYDAIAKKLLDSGSGAHAFIVTDWAGQGAHQWMAVNQNGKILWVDPQIGLAQDTPPYHYSEEGGQPGDVVGVHALVCGEDFAPTPLDGYPLSVYSNRPPTPEYLEAQQRTAQQETKPQPPHQAGSQQPDEAETPSGPLPGHASGQYWPQQPWAPYPQHQQPIAQFPQQAGQPAPPLPHATPAQSAPQQGWPPRPHAQQPVPQQHTQYAQYGHQPPVPSQHQAQPGPWQYGQQHAQAGPHSHPPQPVPHQVPWPGPHQPWPQSHAGTPQHGQPVPQHWQQLAPQRSHAPVPPQPGPQLVPHQYLQQPAPHQAVPQHWQQPLSPRTDQRAYPHAPAPPQPAPEAGPRQAQHPAPPHHGWAPPDAAPSDAPSAHPRPEEQAVQRDFQARYEPPAPPVHPQPAPEQPASDQAPPTDRTAEGGEPDVESFYLPVRDIELIRLLKDDRAIKGLFENGLEGLLKNLSEDKQREILSGLRTSWHEAETLIKKTYRDLAYVMVIQAPRNSEMAQALRALVEGRLPGGDPGFASAIKGESLRRVIRLERDYDTEHPPLREPRPTYGKKKRWLAEEDEPVKPNEPEYEYQHYTRKSYENPNFSLEQAKAEQPRAPHADGSASASQPPEPVSLARPRPSTDQRAHPAPAGAPTPTAFRGGPETPGSDRDSSRLEHHQTRSALAAPSHGHPPAPGSPPPPGSMPPPGSAVPPGGETPSSQSPVPKPENFSPELSGAFDRLPPKAQEQLVQLFERNGGRSVGVQRRLEGMAKGILGHAVPLGQIPTDTLVEILEQSAARDKANQPIPLSPDRAADRPLLEKVTDLQRQSERAWELWKEFEERHPGIPGTNDWARRLREQDKAIDEMRRDRREATAEKINGTRGNIAGIHAEIEAALKIPRLPADQLRELASRELRISEVSKKLRFGKFRSDADVIFVDESGRPIWVDTKDYPPFSSKSERWEKLGKQVENQIEIAKAEAVAGRRLPEVAFYFPKGVDPSVCQKLQEKGVIVIGEFRFYRGDGPGSEGGEME